MGGESVGNRVTLEDMLQARDRRQMRQRELAGKWPGSSLVIFTVVAPGEEKSNRNTRVVAGAGARVLAGEFAADACLWEELDLPTGYELWIVSPVAPLEAKRRVCAIENSHPLGRLMDIDVIGEDLRPISRTAVGFPERTCLVCGENARICMRAARHSYQDILRTITDTVDRYVADV